MNNFIKEYDNFINKDSVDSKGLIEAKGKYIINKPEKSLLDKIFNRILDIIHEHKENIIVYGSTAIYLLAKLNKWDTAKLQLEDMTDIDMYVPDGSEDVVNHISFELKQLAGDNIESIFIYKSPYSDNKRKVFRISVNDYVICDINIISQENFNGIKKNTTPISYKSDDNSKQIIIINEMVIYANMLNIIQNINYSKWTKTIERFKTIQNSIKDKLDTLLKSETQDITSQNNNIHDDFTSYINEHSKIVNDDFWDTKTELYVIGHPEHKYISGCILKMNTPDVETYINRLIEKLDEMKKDKMKKYDVQRQNNFNDNNIIITLKDVNSGTNNEYYIFIPNVDNCVTMIKMIKMIKLNDINYVHPIFLKLIIINHELGFINIKDINNVKKIYNKYKENNNNTVTDMVCPKKTIIDKTYQIAYVKPSTDFVTGDQNLIRNKWGIGIEHEVEVHRGVQNIKIIRNNYMTDKDMIAYKLNTKDWKNKTVPMYSNIDFHKYMNYVFYMEKNYSYDAYMNSIDVTFEYDEIHKYNEIKKKNSCYIR